jgi:hypothetical protein
MGSVKLLPTQYPDYHGSPGAPEIPDNQTDYHAKDCHSNYGKVHGYSPENLLDDFYPVTSLLDFK